MERREWGLLGIIVLLGSTIFLQTGFYTPSEEPPPLTPPLIITDSPVNTITEPPISTIIDDIPVVTTVITSQQMTTTSVSTIQPPPVTTPPVTSESPIFPTEKYGWDVAGTWGSGSFIVRYRLDFMDSDFNRISPGVKLFIGGSTASMINVPANAFYVIIMIEEIVIHVREDPALLLDQTMLRHWVHLQADSSFGGTVWASFSGSSARISDFSAFTTSEIASNRWDIRRSEWELARNNLDWFTIFEYPFDGDIVLRTRIQLSTPFADSGVYEHEVTLNYP
jgi:hypothetical protein